MRPFALLDSTCMRSQSIHARGSLFSPCMRPFTRAAFYSTCLLSLLPYACDQIHSSRLFQLLLGTLSILQLSYGCSSLYSLVSKPAFNLHASMPVESKPKTFHLVRIISRYSTAVLATVASIYL